MGGLERILKSVERATIRPVSHALRDAERHVLRPVAHAVSGRRRVTVTRTWAEVSAERVALTATETDYTLADLPDPDPQCAQGGHQWQPFTEHVEIHTSDDVLAVAANFCQRCGVFQFTRTN